MENLAINKLLRDNFEEYSRNHSLPHHVISACYKMIKCRTSDLGGSVYECPNKDFRKIVYNSCKHRSCPSCNLINIENWINKIKANLLPASYYHFVFTIPEELNDLFLKNRHLLTNLLFICSQQSIEKMIKNEFNVIPGIISTLHTWSRTLNFHPHIHMLITAGGMDIDTEDWKENKTNWLINVKGLSMIFRGKLLDAIHKEVYNNNLIFEKGFNKFRTHRKLKELRKKKWNVFISEKYDYAKGVAIYLGKYVRGGPISNKRIISFDKDKVNFRFQDLKDNKSKVLTLEIKEFLKRLLLHIPDKRQILVRYYGLFSNFKSKRLKNIRSKMGIDKISNTIPLKAKDFLKSREVFDKACFCPFCKIELILIGKYNKNNLNKILEMENYLKKDENYRKKVA